MRERGWGGVGERGRRRAARGRRRALMNDKADESKTDASLNRMGEVGSGKRGKQRARPPSLKAVSQVNSLSTLALSRPPHTPPPMSTHALAAGRRSLVTRASAASPGNGRSGSRRAPAPAPAAAPAAPAALADAPPARAKVSLERGAEQHAPAEWVTLAPDPTRAACPPRPPCARGGRG